MKSMVHFSTYIMYTYQAFIRVRDLRFLELIHNIEVKHVVHIDLHIIFL